MNKYRPHVLLIPEDDANRQLANGFILHHAIVTRAIGAPDHNRRRPGHVLAVFADEYLAYLRSYKDAYVILLIDFDGDDDRRTKCEQSIPADVKPRVFLVGSRDEPEAVKRDVPGSLEAIGMRLAEECYRERHACGLARILTTTTPRGRDSQRPSGRFCFELIDYHSPHTWWAPTMTALNEHYILATGGKDLERLRLLHQVYGPGTEALFHRVGLHDGMRVVEVGCGSGNIACWVAAKVGAAGRWWRSTTAPTRSSRPAGRRQARGLRNIAFQVADAYSPRLPEGSFDVAYCRLVLIHLTDPGQALAAMRRLVRPGGKVVCEEMDLGCRLCDPPSDAMRRFFELNEALGERRGEHFRLGASLHRLFPRPVCRAPRSARISRWPSAANKNGSSA